jgi:hypothetical protein
VDRRIYIVESLGVVVCHDGRRHGIVRDDNVLGSMISAVIVAGESPATPIGATTAN